MNQSIDPNDVEDADFEEESLNQPGPASDSSSDDSLLKKPVVWIVAGGIVLLLLLLFLLSGKDSSNDSEADASAVAKDIPAKQKQNQKQKQNNSKNKSKQNKQPASRKPSNTKPNNKNPSSAPSQKNNSNNSKKSKNKQTSPPPAFKIKNQRNIQEEKATAASLLLEKITQYAKESPKAARSSEQRMIAYLNKRLAKDRKSRRAFAILDPKKLEIKYIVGVNRIFSFYRDGKILRVNSSEI